MSRKILFITAFILAGLPSAIVLASERDQVKQQCKELGDIRYPIVNETIKTPIILPRTVPDGGMKCETESTLRGADTVCKPTTQLEYYTTYRDETRDLNLDARSRFIAGCVPSRCLELYGDSSCKIRNKKYDNSFSFQSTTSLTQENARLLLISVFGEEWVASPTCGVLGDGFGVFGNNGYLSLPYEKIDFLFYDKRRGVIGVGDETLLTVKIHQVQVSLDDQQVSSIREAFIALGAKLKRKS